MVIETFSPILHTKCALNLQKTVNLRQFLVANFHHLLLPHNPQQPLRHCGSQILGPC